MNVFKYILEINDVSYKWYFVIISSLIIINFLIPESLKELGISLKLLIIILIISSALKIIYRREKAKKSVKLLSSMAENHFQQIFIFLGGALIIVWAVLQNNHMISLRSYLVETGFYNSITIILFSILYFFILMSIFENKNIVLEQDKNSDVFSDAEAIKFVYKNKKENIKEDRVSDRYPLRRHAHVIEYESIINLIDLQDKNNSILDNGCGDGTLAILMAKRGFNVAACDISDPNIEYAKERAIAEGVGDKIKFLTADSENLPFDDNSFEYVISSHVLEHLPSFDKGLQEVRRITRNYAIIALPTCLNPCAWVILGGDRFWAISRWSLSAWFIGLGQVILNLGGIGVNEGYGGDKKLPHVWRYPWIMRKDLKRGGFKIIHFEASSLCLPYFNFLLPIIKYLEKFKSKPIIRNFGYGSIAVLKK